METDLNVLKKWIFDELAIDVSSYKDGQMDRRLSGFMARYGKISAADYIKVLEKNPELKQKLADFITINVSEFFRNKDLFDDLEKKIKIYLENKSSRLNIWSAACSNGAEPYSLAIIMDRLTPGVRHNILATDIDSTILKKAKEAVYGTYDIKNVDNVTLKRYFSCNGDKYILNRDIVDRVTFKKHDLIHDIYDTGFDLIVCRNVVIYFKPEVKDRIYKKFYDSLVPGGLLFVGATESIYNYRELGLDKVSSFIYKKR